MKTTEKVLVAIRTFIKSNGYSPSIREIGSTVGQSEPSVIIYHLRKLENQGRIKRTKNLHRCIEVLDYDG